MLLTLPQVLAPDVLLAVWECLAGAQFVDGRRSAGKAAAAVKANQELALQAEAQAGLQRQFMTALAQHPGFRSAALPHQVTDLIVARYTPSMTYGTHVDDPLMAGGKLRADVAFTLFLSAPEDYVGGELQIRTAFGWQQVKLAAGDGVLYPASSLHRVAPVTQGERLVAVGWVQSLVRDAAQRELLYELDQARMALLDTGPQAETTALVNRSYANLMRMWAEP